MKTTTLRIMICLLILAVMFLAIFPKEQTKNDASDWMSDLDDCRTLTSLAIPGTHDSGALYSFADIAGKCQSLTVKEQLKAGVRFFDIRLQQRGEQLAVVHSFVDQMTDFSDIMEQMTAFLREHPSEFLLESIKEDADAVNAEHSFAEAVETMISGCGDVVSTVAEFPETVGDARGKIIILSRYDGASIGIPVYHGWSDNTSFALDEMYVQDRYAISDISEKQEEFLSALDVASDETVMVLNYTSCYQTSGFPPSYAATPAKELNPWLKHLLTEKNTVRSVIICDFMTSALAETIWRCNFK